MRVVVIGGSGHIGSYLVPRLVRAGHEVVSLSRGNTLPYTPNMRAHQKVFTKKGIEIRPAASGGIDEAEYARIWKDVRVERVDRLAMEAEGAFGKKIAAYRPDCVCDLICYRPEQARQQLEAGAGTDWHAIVTGSVWVFARNYYEPVDEAHPRTGVGEYGENKIAMEALLLEGERRATVVHPGHVVGRGWIPINPQGNFNLEVYRSILRGEALTLPDDGSRTLHPVHAEDVAGLIEACMNQPEASTGQAFLSVGPTAPTLLGFANAMYAAFHREASIRFEPMQMFLNALGPEDRAQSDEHLSRSPCASMQKARERLGFVPKFSTMDSILDALDALISMGLLKTGE